MNFCQKNYFYFLFFPPLKQVLICLDYPKLMTILHLLDINIKQRIYPAKMFSERGLTPIDRELSKKVVKIIHGLLMMDESAAFRKPVPHKALGLEDYKLIVKKPTDLNLIRRQNNQGKYKFVEEILDDIQLCWDNCKLYNAIGSEIYQQAIDLEKAFDKFGQEILPQFWTGINREDYNQKFYERKVQEQKNKRTQTKAQPLKNEYPVLSKEQSMKMKSSKKQVTFQSRQMYESSEYIQEDPNLKVQEKEMEPQQQSSIHQDLGNPEKVSMDVEEGEQGQSAIPVDPIIVNLYEKPSQSQLLQISETMKSLYLKEDFLMLQKVLEILHSNEKENMTLNKNGLMSFRMDEIHKSTYLRICKLLGIGEEGISLIE